ncbi:MAG: hypothetical protein VW496_01210 [Pelagibacteraceae bacterium]
MREEAMKAAGDVFSISVIVGTLANWLPSIAAIISIIWGAIRIYETDTVQRMLGRR